MPIQTIMFAPSVATIGGRIAFAAVFALLIVWLSLIPSGRIHSGGQRVAWWRNVRFWALAIAASQMLLYLLWR